MNGGGHSSAQNSLQQVEKDMIQKGPGNVGGLPLRTVAWLQLTCDRGMSH